MRVRQLTFRRGAPKIAALFAVGLLTAACGSDGNDTESSATTAASTETTASSQTETTASDTATSAAETGTSTAEATTSVAATSRGFDGTTVKVAGLGISASFPGAEVGARARILKFNETNELPGVKIEYTEFVDDKADPAVALSEARRLVTDTEVFAIVGDVSATNPGDYFKEQHVPYFGWAFDNTYCSNDGDETIYGFGFNGCIAPADPQQAPDSFLSFYNYVKKQTGKDHPTVAGFSGDTESGKSVAKLSAIQLAGVGFDVVYSEGAIPPPPVTDYTPYVQQLMTADDGNPPDAIISGLALDSIQIWSGLQNAGYKGYYLTGLYSDALLEPMKGTYAQVTFVPFDTPSDGLTDMTTYLAKVNAEYKADTGAFSAWASTDMFIQALKAAQADGGISPENVHDKAMNQTWEIKGFAGPTTYPDSLAHSSPACSALTFDDGTVWKTVEPYTCSSKLYPVTD